MSKHNLISLMYLCSQMNDFFQFHTLMDQIGFGITGLFCAIQLYFLIFVYSKLRNYNIPENRHSDDRELPPVSVIICAHNEAENLTNFLPTILQQEYSVFEVVVVNDFSSDDTIHVLKHFATQYPHLKIVDIQEYIRMKHGKKFAVSMGIKGSKYERLVFTDADCQPASAHWLQEISAAFGSKTEIVLGYSPYFWHKGLLNKLIQFETTHTAMSYLSYALKKDPYMGVGRNMAYAKSLFFRNKGFAAHMHIKSGDDDLFVNQNATKSNVNIVLTPESVVYSEPKTTWKSYYKQKARHAGASVLYKGRHKFMLGMQLCSGICFYAALIAFLLISTHLFLFAIGIYLLRFIIQLVVIYPVYKKLQVKKLIWWLPLLDFIYYFYICINGIFNRKKKKISWS